MLSIVLSAKSKGLRNIVGITKGEWKQERLSQWGGEAEIRGVVGEEVAVVYWKRWRMASSHDKKASSLEAGG